MMLNAAITLSLLLLSLQCAAKDAPAELKGLVLPQESLLAFAVADLNGDGLEDFVFVVEIKPSEASSEKEDDGKRVLKIALRYSDNSLSVVKVNEKVVHCRKCGGSWGDPFGGLNASKRTFSIEHAGGSSWRWSNSYQFNYSRKDGTWQLVYVEENSYHSSDPNKITNKTYRPPKSFGKIDISEFDPEHFEGVGKK